MKFAVYATGYKGYKFLCNLNTQPAFVVSYNNKERKDRMHYNKIKEWCNTNDIAVYDRKDFTAYDKAAQNVDKIFVIGWQYIIRKNLGKIVVFHDSYLPEKRGFSPTVSSLLEEEETLGASCFKPSLDTRMGPDYGEVYYRKKVKICYPITLAAAFDIVTNLYVEMANEIIKSNKEPEAIDYSESTFSLWRDEADTRLDWSEPATKIKQKIESLGFPYMGATTVYDDSVIYLQEVMIIEGINFSKVEDHYGKIWKLEDNHPYIVCGTDVIKILAATDTNDNKVNFTKIRKRLK